MTKEFTFSLKNLHRIDDGVTADFEEHLREIVGDCRNRPKCGADRTITIVVGAVPSDKEPDGVLLSLSVSSLLPQSVRKAAPRNVKARSTTSNQLQMQFDDAETVTVAKPQATPSATSATKKAVAK